MGGRKTVFMATNYSEQDLHWITVHPNGKGEKPGVKVAINGAGKVVKGPKGLKDDINADGGLPGAKSVPLDELKKQSGGGSVGVEANPEVETEAGESDAIGLPDDLNGLFDEAAAEGGESDVMSPDYIANLHDLLGDEPIPLAKTWLESQNTAAYKSWLLAQGFSQEEAGTILEEIAATLNEDDFINGNPLLAAPGTDKVWNAMMEAAKAKMQGGVPQVIPQAKEWLENDSDAKCYLQKLQDKGGFSKEEAKKKLEEIASVLKEDDFYGASPFLSIYGFVLDKKIIPAVEKAIAEKSAEANGGGEAELCDSLKEWMALYPSIVKLYESKFASKEDFHKALASLTDDDFMPFGGKMAIKTESLKKLNPDGGGLFSGEQVENFLNSLTSPFGAAVSDEYKQAMKEVVAEHPELFAESKDDPAKMVYASADAASKAMQLAMDKQGGDGIIPQAKAWKGSISGMICLGELQKKGLSLKEAEQKLKEIAATLEAGDFSGRDLTFGGKVKVGNAIEEATKGDKQKPADNGGLCASAQKWMDDPHASPKSYLLGLVKAKFAISDDDAKKMMSKMLESFTDADFDADGSLTTDGLNKLDKKIKNTTLDKVGDYLKKDQPEGEAEAQAPVAPQAAKPAAPLPPPTPAKPVSEELTSGGYPFPKDEKGLSGLTMVKELGGGSGAHATLYKDADGNMFVMKRFPKSDKTGQRRIREECDADAFYLSGGANVPHFRLYGDEKSGYTKLSQYIPGTKTLGQAWGSADDALKEKITQNLRKDFALDVMAGAWDVLGEGRDNILVDGDGNVWRCDNGCAFNRRAKGGEKDEVSWGSGHIDDLWTMRGMSPSLDGAKVSDPTGKADFFGGITTHQLLSDIASRDWEKMTAHLPEATRQVMAKRIANAKEYHSVCDNVVNAGMYGDGKHAEDITLNYHCLNKFGAKAGCTNKDIGPGNWGWCRGNGTGNPAPKLDDYLLVPKPKLTDFTNAPEPKPEDFLPANSADKGEAAKKLLAAGKSINHHLYDNKDGHVNATTVADALALKPSLEAVANDGGADAAKAKEMLAFLGEVEKVKAGGYKPLSEKFSFAPSGDVDLNTQAAKDAAQKKYEAAHKDWEDKTANAQAEFAKATKGWKKLEKDAKAKLAEETKKWQAANGGQAFKWKNLTDCFEDFCKQNGIESKRFWNMAGEQGGQSYKMGSCRMKVMEILSMGGNLDHPTSSVNGISDHMPNVHLAAQEYKSHPDWLERDMKSYVAMKSLTHMLLQNSSFTGNFQDKKCVRMCRTEDENDVILNYGIKKGAPTVFPCGAHESFGVFKTYCYHGHGAVLCDVPYSRISSLYFLKNPQGGDMYAGDSENEAGVNAVGLPRVYVRYTPGAEPIKDMWDGYEKAMKKKVVAAGM